MVSPIINPPSCPSYTIPHAPHPEPIHPPFRVQGHTCDENAWCSPGLGYGGYECLCKDGFKKDDRGDCVRDVRVAVNHCRRNTCPYHCR